MSDLGLDLDREHHTHRRRRRRGGGLGCLAVLIALAILAGGAYFAYDRGMEALRDRFDPAPDYSGTGKGTVLVEVKDGDNATDIANTLVGQDVVKSVEAFTDAAMANPESTGIQVGFYKMKKQMSAESALDVLIEPEQHGAERGHRPRGLPAGADRRHPRQGDRLLQAAVREGAPPAQRDRPSAVRQRQRRGLPLPRDVHAAAQRARPSRC